MTERIERCQNCKWWGCEFARDGQRYSMNFCKKNAPSGWAWWPRTSGDDWCGQFEKES